MKSDYYEFDKQEIAVCLLRMRDLISIASNNVENSFSELYRALVRYQGCFQDGSEISFHNMVEISEIMLLSKMLTINYDIGFGYLLESQLNKVEIPDEIFVNKDDAKRFSNKNKIKFIRNAFNHNDYNDLLKIVREKGIIKVEIKLNKTNPIPFHVSLDIDSLLKIIYSLNQASTINLFSLQCDSYVSINENNFEKEMSSVYLREFYSKKKLDNKNLKEVRKILNNKKTKGLEKYLSKLGMDYNDYRLSDKQIKKMKEDFKFWKNMGLDGNQVVTHLIYTIYPLSQTKLKSIYITLCLLDYYVKFANFSMKDFVCDVKDCINFKSCDKDSPLYLYINEFGLNLEMFLDACDYDNIYTVIDSLYLGYLFDTLIKDENIKVSDELIYPREKIRNAFVHMRWYRGKHASYELFDWNNGLSNKMKYNWNATITGKEINECSNRYLNEILTNDSKEDFLGYPILFVRDYNEDKELLKGISLLKNRKYYHCSLLEKDLFTLYVAYDTEERIANEEETKIFLNEFNNLSDKDKFEYSDIIETVKENIIYEKSNIFFKRKIKKR